MLKRQEVGKNIYLLKFGSQKELTSSFLRIQENYESPKFRNKIFTLAEFKKWNPASLGKTKFTYYSDWNGFNVPSYVIERFREGNFNPLSSKEKAILEALDGLDGEFYVIAIHGQKTTRTLRHEMIHGLFYTNPSYREKVENLILEYQVSELKHALRKMGYCSEVLVDEINAYLAEGTTGVSLGGRVNKPDDYKELQQKLMALLKKYETKNFYI